MIYKHLPYQLVQDLIHCIYYGEACGPKWVATLQHQPKHELQKRNIPKKTNYQDMQHLNIFRETPNTQKDPKGP